MLRELQLRDGRKGVIRYATEADAKEIIEKMEKMIRNENYLEEDEETLNDIDEEKREIKKMKREGSLYAVIDIGGKIGGVLVLKRGRLEMNHHIVNVRIWITEEFRGNGLGGILMEYGIKWSESNKVKKVCLDVFDNNPRAIKLYEKYGFIKEGHRKQQYIIDGQFVDEIFMSKFI